jgi:hypothetical protein
LLPSDNEQDGCVAKEVVVTLPRPASPVLDNVTAGYGSVTIS